MDFTNLTDEQLKLFAALVLDAEHTSDMVASSLKSESIKKRRIEKMEEYYDLKQELYAEWARRS